MASKLLRDFAARLLMRPLLSAKKEPAKTELTAVEWLSILERDETQYFLVYDAKWTFFLRRGWPVYDPAKHGGYLVCKSTSNGELVLAGDNDAAHGHFDTEAQARLMLEMQGFIPSETDCMDWIVLTQHDVWWRKTTKAWLLNRPEETTAGGVQDNEHL